MVARTGPRKFGVTLIELMMVISLIGITAAVVTPRYTESLNQFRAETAAERIRVDLNMARRRASITGRSISVIFDAGTNTYAMPNLASLDRSQLPYQMSLSASPFYAILGSVSFPGGIGGDMQVVFDHYGAPDSGGSVAVRCGGTAKTVSLNATTGEATIP